MHFSKLRPLKWELQQPRGNHKYQLSVHPHPMASYSPGPRAWVPGSGSSGLGPRVRVPGPDRPGSKLVRIPRFCHEIWTSCLLYRSRLVATVCLLFYQPIWKEKGASSSTTHTKKVDFDKNITQFQVSTLIFVYIFKYAYKHIPCVESAYTAIHDTKINL